MRYRNFDISIDERVSDGYLLKAASEVFGEARGLLSLDLNSSKIQKDLEYLEERDTNREFLIQFGTDLYKYLFRNEIETIFQQSYGEALSEEDTGLRVRLRIQPPQMAIMPWELLYHPSADCFMGTSERSPIVRYLEINQRIRSLETRFPLSVLVVIPQYPDPNLALDTDIEKHHLTNIFNTLKKYVQVTFLEGQVTTDLISHALLERPYNCFHFIGHGEFKDDKGFILLNTENNGIDYLDEDRFASLFQNHPAMKLMMLNSCKGAETSSTRPMVGMAPKLVRRGIPAVIAMQYAILDEAAIFFAREFYQKLFKGWNTGRVDVAMTHARNRLASEFANDREMCTPVLFMRAKEGVLFNPLTGNLLKDIPFSKQDLYRSEAIAKTYTSNNAIKKTPEDTIELKRLIKRIRFRRYVQITAIASALLMFFFSWVNIFDYFNLDTRIETYTMALGESFAKKTFSDKILIVSIEDNSFGKDWRKEKHPVLINKLAKAGAKVIVFDMVFETPTEFDSEFVAAIQQAKNDGAHVIVGIRDIEGDRAKIVKEIEQAVSGVGITCVGRKLGLARVAPLAVIDKDESDQESRKGKYYSLALTAYAAYNDYDIWDIDLKNSHINLLFAAEHRTHEIPFAELTSAKETHGCSVIQRGDRVADIFIDPLPIEILNQREISYTELIDSTDLDQFKGKIVIIGSPKGDISIRGITGRHRRFGFELQAQVLNTLISGVFIHSLNMGWQLILMIILGIFGGLIRYKIPKTSHILRRFVVFSIISVYLAGTLILYVQYHLLLNTIYHVGAFGLSYWAAGRIERRILL